MIKEGEMKFLKMFVYAMGIVMMLGIMIITYTIYKRNILLDEQYANITLPCSKNISIELPADKEVRSSSVAGNLLSILTEDSQILIYDQCSGNLLKTVNLIKK
jgi:hypothetical protein